MELFGRLAQKFGRPAYFEISPKAWGLADPDPVWNPEEKYRHFY